MADNNYQYNPDEWVNIHEVKVEDPNYRGNGVIIRVYKKNTDRMPRMGIREFYTDKNTNEIKNGKQIRINPAQLQQIFEGLKECYEKVRTHSS